MVLNKRRIHYTYIILFNSILKTWRVLSLQVKYWYEYLKGSGVLFDDPMHFKWEDVSELGYYFPK